MWSFIAAQSRNLLFLTPLVGNASLERGTCNGERRRITEVDSAKVELGSTSAKRHSTGLVVSQT